MKESRLQRLQQATRREELVRVEAITKELHANATSKTRQLVASATSSWPRPSSVVWPHPPSSSRTVFLSIAALERSYQAVPRDVLDPAIFVFGTERKWWASTSTVMLIMLAQIPRLVAAPQGLRRAHEPAARSLRLPIHELRLGLPRDADAQGGGWLGLLVPRAFALHCWRTTGKHI